MLTSVNSHTHIAEVERDQAAPPNKEVEEAVAYAESKGWSWRKMGHWGRIFCPHVDRDGCQVGVNSTPKKAGNHARQVMRVVDRCPHVEKKEDGDENI